MLSGLMLMLMLLNVNVNVNPNVRSCSLIGITRELVDRLRQMSQCRHINSDSRDTDIVNSDNPFGFAASMDITGVM